MDKIQINNTEDVRRALVDQINALREKKCEPAEANSVANLVGKILQTVKIDIEVSRHLKGGGTGSSTPLLSTKL